MDPAAEAGDGGAWIRQRIGLGSVVGSYRLAVGAALPRDRSLTLMKVDQQ